MLTAGEDYPPSTLLEGNDTSPKREARSDRVTELGNQSKRRRHRLLVRTAATVIAILWVFIVVSAINDSGLHEEAGRNSRPLLMGSAGQ